MLPNSSYTLDLSPIFHISTIEDIYDLYLQELSGMIKITYSYSA